MIYVIDHKDSFTHNVVHQFSLFDKVECANYDEIDNAKLNKAKTIILSPGPGSPKDYPKTKNIYRKYKSKKKNNRNLFRFPANIICRGRSNNSAKTNLPWFSIRYKSCT